MGVFRSLGVVLWAWREVARLSFDLRLWSPLLLLTLLRLLSLIALTFFHHPRLVEVLAPVLRALGGEPALHYPEHLYLLPQLYERLDVLLVLVVGSVAAGMVTLRFARAFASTCITPDRRGALRHAPALILVAAVGVGSEWLVSYLIGMIPEEIRPPGVIFRLGFFVLQWSILLVVGTVLAYSVAAIVVRARTARRAIRESLGLARGEPLLTLTLVAVPMGLLFPFLVLGNIDLDERGVLPEGLVIVVFLQIVTELFAGWLMLGSVTRVYVWLKEVRR